MGLQQIVSYRTVQYKYVYCYTPNLSHEMKLIETNTKKQKQGHSLSWEYAIFIDICIYIYNYHPA